MANWQGFRFANPTTAGQAYFNQLAMVDPQLAYAWAFSSSNPMPGIAMDVKHGVDAYLGGNYGNALINMFTEPGADPASTVLGQSLGLPAGWMPPMIGIDADGTAFRWDSSSGQLQPGQRYPISGGGIPPTTPPTTTPPTIPPTTPPINTPPVTTDGPGGFFGPAGPGGGSNPYAAIASLLPGYGLSQNLGSPGHGFGIPGFENTPTRAGGSWAGTTFNPNGPTTLRQDMLPASDPYAEYRARYGIGTNGEPLPGTSIGSGSGAGGGTTTGGGEWAPDGSGRQAAPGYYWVYAPAGGEGEGMVWQQRPIPGGSADTTGTVPSTTTGGGASVSGSRRNWLGVPITNEGWAINQGTPYQTTWYLSTYGGKPAPFINIHEQIGKAMEGVPAAMPTFNWAGPSAMAASQPYAVGMPPGGWTQMLGFVPGGTK